MRVSVLYFEGLLKGVLFLSRFRFILGRLSILRRDVLLLLVRLRFRSIKHDPLNRMSNLMLVVWIIFFNLVAHIRSWPILDVVVISTIVFIWWVIILLDSSILLDHLIYVILDLRSEEVS